jgi:outer membrane murein-binding lipoprotein Lpp
MKIMKMKRVIFIGLLTATLIAVIIFTGCQSPAQKEKKAAAKVEDAKQELIKAQNEVKADDIKTANREEWKAFQNDAEMKIKKNEIRITELKIRMKKPGKAFDAVYGKRIETLEMKNKELETKMENYENKQSDWDSFKLEFNHDMDMLSQALRDITVSKKN